MQITFESFDDREEYQSLLVINAQKRWKETLYFTYFTPWDGNEEKLYAGRYMADVHFKNKPCECVLVFDFHKWTAETISAVSQLDLPPTSFKTDLPELLEKALDQREGSGNTFDIKVKER